MDPMFSLVESVSSKSKKCLDLRSVLDIDPSANWEELLSSKLKIKPDLDENEFSDVDDNELKRFTLGN